MALALQPPVVSTPTMATPLTVTSDAPWSSACRNLHRLPGNDQAIVSDSIEAKAVRGDEGVFIILFLRVQAEVDFVAGQIGQLGRTSREVAAEFDRPSSIGEAVAASFPALNAACRPFGSSEITARPAVNAFGRIWRCERANPGEADVEAVEERSFPSCP